MVFELIIASVLIAFGIYTIYRSIDEGISDQKIAFILLVGIVAIIFGLWLLLVTYTLAVLLKKLAGLIISLIGLFLVVGFPDIKIYQHGFGITGIFIGLIVLIFGILLLIF